MGALEKAREFVAKGGPKGQGRASKTHGIGNKSDESTTQIDVLRLVLPMRRELSVQQASTGVAFLLKDGELRSEALFIREAWWPQRPQTSKGEKEDR
eukprot:3837363-Pyramimonas_sp.AAC.1